MTWTKNSTCILFYTIFILSVLCMLVYLVCYANLLKKKEHRSLISNDLLSLMAATFGTGYGCIWFRVTQSRSTVGHAVVHTLTFIVMIYARRSWYTDYYLEGDYRKLFHMFSIALVTYVVYFIQFILSFHLLVFRTGRTRDEKAFRAFLHAFGGALTHFLCVMDSTQMDYELFKDYHTDPGIPSWSVFCLLAYGRCVWFLMLTPYFDWRRMHKLMRPRPSKTVISQRLSRPSIRRSSSNPQRYSHRLSVRNSLPNLSRSASNRGYDV